MARPGPRMAFPNWEHAGRDLDLAAWPGARFRTGWRVRFPFKLSPVVGLLTLLMLGAGCTSVRPTVLPPLSPANRWAKEIGAFDTQDATSPPPRRPIVFTGSSSIRLWKELPQDYPGLRVMNRGFGGSQLSDVQEHFERLVLRYQPRQVVIYCGGNDLAAKNRSRPWWRT